MNYDNETLRILHERVSCRNFAEDKIDSELFDAVMEAGLQAPTGGDFQPYSIIKIENQATKKELAKLSRDQNYVAKAPVNLLFCIDWRRIKRMTELEVTPFNATDNMMDFWMSLVEIGIVSQNVCIAAESMGLKSVFIGNVVEFLPEIKDLLDIPEYVVPAMLVCLGHPKSKLVKHKKYKKEIIIHNEKYKDQTENELKASFKERYNNKQMKITDKRLEEYWKNSKRMHGEKFADKSVEYVKKSGGFDFYQYSFGLFYDELEGAMTNSDYFEFMKKNGFAWLEK